MPNDPMSFTDVAYAHRRRVSPWAVPRDDGCDDSVVAVGQSVHTIILRWPAGQEAEGAGDDLRMYLLQAWFALSDEGVNCPESSGQFC